LALATIAVLGSFDTKGVEFAYLIEQIRARQHDVLLIDTSILGKSSLKPHIRAEEVAEAGGQSLTHLREHQQRGPAMQVMAQGATKVVSNLYISSRIDAIIGMGGSGGTAVFAAAVRDLPVGFPKLLISTMASGDTRSIVGTQDLILVPSIVDVAGLNRISRRIIANAANAVCGMAEGKCEDTHSTAMRASPSSGKRRGEETVLVLRRQPLPRPISPCTGAWTVGGDRRWTICTGVLAFPLAKPGSASGSTATCTRHCAARGRIGRDARPVLWLDHAHLCQPFPGMVATTGICPRSSATSTTWTPFPTENASLQELMVFLEEAIDIQERHFRLHWILNLAQFQSSLDLPGPGRQVIPGA
jgi:hypothetical protein